MNVFVGTGNFRKYDEAYAFSGVYSSVPSSYYDTSTWLSRVKTILVFAPIVTTLAWYGWLIYGTYICSKSNTAKCVPEVYFSTLVAVIANWVAPITVAVLLCLVALWSIPGSRWEGINDV